MQAAGGALKRAQARGCHLVIQQTLTNLIGKKPNSRQGPWTPGADILEDEWQFVVQLLSYV